MRYLKRYNESFDSREDVLEFCNNQLVSLLDSGYSITVMPIKVKEDDNLL